MAPIRALDGVRVFELSIGIAGPSCGRALAFHGADVLKIESLEAPETIRLLGSAWARSPEHAPLFHDTSPFLAEFGAGKRSVGLNLKNPAGMAAAHRLIAASDVFLTNLSTPAVRRMGLAYDDVRVLKEDVVYVALPGFGSDERLPYYGYVSWGPNQAPLVGIDDLTGEPGREPPGVTSSAPPDYIAGLHAAIAVLAGLEQRDATGRGCVLDVSQFEASASLLGPFLADHDLSGRVQERTGNRHPHAAPSGAYPCRGRDRYVAVTVTDDDAWARFGGTKGAPLWAADDRFATAPGRRRHHDELDQLFAGWTAERTADEAAARLQAAGVAAHPVLDAPGLLLDAQIRARDWYQLRPSQRFRRDLFGDHPVRLADTPGDVRVAGPSLGEHTVDVLSDVGGFSSEQIAELVASGAAYTEVDPGRVLRRPYDAYLEAFGLGTGEGQP